MAKARTLTSSKTRQPKVALQPKLTAKDEERVYRSFYAILSSFWWRLEPIYRAKLKQAAGPVLKRMGDPIRVQITHDMADPLVKRFVIDIVGMFDRAARQARLSLGQRDAGSWDVRNVSIYDQIKQHEIKLAESTINDLQAATADEAQRLLEEMQKELLEGQKAGETLADKTDRLAKFFAETARWKARRIAVTESNRAHNYGFLAGTQDMEVVVGYEWLLSDDACEECKRIGLINGKPRRVKKGQPFATGQSKEDYYATVQCAPLHPNCVLGDTPIIAPGLMSAVSAQYKGRLVALKTADGSIFTVTPNHMILTPSGWARAQDLRKGDDVIRTPLVEVGATAPSGGGPDDHNRPALAKEIFNSLRMSAGVTTAIMPASAEDLHGDGAGCQGEIDIVFANSLLPDELDAAVGQKTGESVFQLAGASDDGFTCGGSLENLFVASLNATNGVVGRSREIAAIRWGESRHSDPVGFGSGADSNTHLCKPSQNNRTADTEVLRHLQDAVPGVVCTTNVVDIEIFAVHDPVPVYDFQTNGTQYIIGNGIISSNCRCTVVAVLDDEAPEKWDETIAG